MFTFLDGPWKDWKLNENWDLCDSYSSSIFSPSDGLKPHIIKATAKYRSRGRLPILSFFYRLNGSCISRCSQPNAGLLGKSCEEDQLYIKMVRESVSPGGNLLIFDARSSLAAAGNKFRGKGTEDLSNYPNCEMYFMDIENIHAMRDSLEQLRKIILSSGYSDVNWFQDLHSTSWLRHIRAIIRAACRIASQVHEKPTSLLVHCSDGWDRTAQLCSLAQLMLDPFYRTSKGFQILIDKEWMCFGHKFRDRLGYPLKPDERSPVFLQFLDCTYQLMSQFPTAFEFNDSYLISIVDWIHTGWFGNFLSNSIKEASENGLSSKTASMWTFLDTMMETGSARNSSYVASKSIEEGFLLPVANMKVFRFWANLYLRYDCSVLRSKVLSKSTLISEDRSSRSKRSTEADFDSKEAKSGATEEMDELQSEMLVDDFEFNVDGDSSVQKASFLVPFSSVSTCFACQKPFDSIWERKKHCHIW